MTLDPRLSALGLALLLPSPTAAAQSAQVPTRDTIPTVALVISGGASLGVHEAGYMYALGEVLKRAGIRVRVTTGASAGSGNALLTAVNSCLPPNDRPTRDHGYRVWVSAGLDSLDQADARTPVSTFTAEPGLRELRALGEHWERGLPESCDVALGITVTRLTPLEVRLTERLTAPRQLMRFTVRLRGRGPGLVPVLENVVDPDSRAPQLLLPFSPDPKDAAAGRRDLERVIQVVAASGAFPIAFAPVRLRYCVHRAMGPGGARGGGAATCAAPTDSALFVDGGVFDNVPLRLASVLAGGAGEGEGRTLFIYMDPDLRAYPTPEPQGGSGEPADVVAYAKRLLSGAFGHARKTELFSLLEERPEALDDLLIASNRYPQASGFLANFFGLFEEGFRRFDFTLGMYDALADLAGWDRLPTAAAREELLALLPTDEWRALGCLMGWVEPGWERMRATCEDPTLEDFRVLLQVAMNRVYSTCSRLGESERSEPIAHPHCRRAVEGQAPPAIVNRERFASTPALRDSSETDELDYNFRLLGAYRFRFADLGLERDDAAHARRAIARRLRTVVYALADHQHDWRHSALLRLSTLVTVDPIHYEPSRSWQYVVVGTAQEVGGSFGIGGVPDWLRLNGAFRVDGVVSLLTQDRNEFSVGMFLGPEVELQPLTRSSHMVTVGARAGYLFSLGDNFLTDDCTAERARGDRRDCSGLVLQGVAALSLYERVRLQATVDWFTREVPFDDRSYDVHLAFGVQF